VNETEEIEPVVPVFPLPSPATGEGRGKTGVGDLPWLDLLHPWGKPVGVVDKEGALCRHFRKWTTGLKTVCDSAIMKR